MCCVLSPACGRVSNSADSVVCAGARGASVSYHGPCISNMFTWNTQQQSSSSNKQGMICPGLSIDRPTIVSEGSAEYYNNVVSSDPLLYSYQGCTCAAPLVAYYHVDLAGMLQIYMCTGLTARAYAAKTASETPLSTSVATPLANCPTGWYFDMC